MPPRHDAASGRGRLLDAALVVLGDRGSRGFTHRAVEEVAGLPHGSTRHHFGSTAGLVRAAVEHLAASDRKRLLEAGADMHRPEHVARLLERWLGAERTRTLARYELFLMAARDPALQPVLRAARQVFWELAARSVGSREGARAFVAMLDGLLLDSLALGDPEPAGLAGRVAQLMDAHGSGEPR